ncbi:unnamed protein product [Ixodes hexagonus]
MDEQGRAPLVGTHYSVDSGHESSYSSVRAAESDAAREAWARHPYYSSQEEARAVAQQVSPGHKVEAKGSRSKKDKHKTHRKSSKQGSTGSKGAAKAAAVGDVASLIPDKSTLQHQIAQNRDAMMAKQKELYKKQEEYARYRAINAGGAP